VVYDGKVLLLHDQDAQDMRTKKKNPSSRPSVLVCLDAAKGTVLWEKERPAVRACYSSPFVLEKGGKKELILTTTPGVVAYDLATGAELWHYDWSGNKLRTVASSVASGEMLFVAGGDGSGLRHFVALRLGEKGNASTAEKVWDNKRNKNMPYVPCVLAHNDHLYTVNDEGYVSCLEARTGKEVWKERLGSGQVSASPVLIDGKIYAPDLVGKVHVVEASPTYKKLAENDLGESVSATPAVADGRLIIRGRNHLFCVSRK